MRRNLSAGVGSIALGAGMAANAVLGPLVLDVVRFRETSGMREQQIGGDIASLFLAAPLAVLAGVLWIRGHRAAPVIAAAVGGFAAYMAVQFVLVPDYARYPGNNELLFPLELFLLVVGWTLAARAWRQLASAELPTIPPSLGYAVGGVLLVVNGVVALAWLGSIAPVMRGSFTPDYRDHPTAFWLIRLMDLGVVVPLGIAVGLSLLRRTRRSSAGGYAFLGMQTLLACAVAGMAARMLLAHDPAGSPAVTVIALGGAGILVTLYGLTLRRLS